MQRKISLLPVTAVAAAVIAVVFRVFQLLVVVDYTEMGFFDPAAGFFLGGGIYLLIVIAAAVMILGYILDKKSDAPAVVRSAASLTPKQTAVWGAAFLAGACFRFYDLVFGFNGIDLDFIGEAAIFAVCALIGFMILGKKRLRTTVGYLQIVICISYTLKSAALFMQDTIIIRVSDELILLLSYVASVLFFLALGRFISGNESKLTRCKLLVFGGLTAILSAAASLAGYIALAVDSDYIGAHMSMHPISEIGATIIAFAVIFTMYSGNMLTAEEEVKNEAENSETTDN